MTNGELLSFIIGAGGMAFFLHAFVDLENQANWVRIAWVALLSMAAGEGVVWLVKAIQ